MDMNLELYVDINGVKYQIDPECCSLDVTLSTIKDRGVIKGCLEVTADGKSVCLDIL